MTGPPRRVRLCFERLRRDSSESIQLKEIKGNFYVHRVTSERDGGGKVVKISEHMGAITPEGVFVEKSNRPVRESRREVFEYGNGALAHALLSDVEAILKERGVPYYREHIASAVIRAIAPSPIRLLESRWERLHLSRTINVNLSPKHVSEALRDAGRHVVWWYDLFSKLAGDDGGLLLYDLTTIFTYSRSMKLAEKGYNPDHEYMDQIGVLMAFSRRDAVPVGADVFYGSMSDIATIRDFLQRLPETARKNVGFILDRGFASYELLGDFRKSGISYVVPLRKDSKLVKLDGARWRGTFLYRKRPIRWASIESEHGQLYIFEDPELRGSEEASLLRRVEGKKMKMREFEERRRVAGVIAMLSDMKMKGPEMYDLYKGREDVELAFDALKNTIDADRTYLQSPEGVRGFFLVSFLAMRVYFKILKRLRERKLTNKISVEEVLFELSKVERIVERNGREYYASIPKKARTMLSLFSDTICMG